MKDWMDIRGRWQLQFVGDRTNLSFHFIGPKIAIREFVIQTVGNRTLCIWLQL